MTRSTISEGDRIPAQRLPTEAEVTDNRFTQLRQAANLHTQQGFAVSGPMFAEILTECLDEIERLRRAVKAAMYGGKDDRRFYGHP